jgi:hypothetical protein
METTRMPSPISPPIAVEARRCGLITGRELSAMKGLRGLRAVL